MKILIDMNLSPDWTAVFSAANIESKHWRDIGDPRAKDSEIMAFDRLNGYFVFTHDLDFGALLALTQAESPSVIQVRSQNVLPPHFAETVISVLRKNEIVLNKGALIVIDEARLRIRILPLQR